jgi:hypothetical protein
MVGVGSYALSAILLVVLGASVGFAAFRNRRHLLPAWEGLRLAWSRSSSPLPC